MVLVIAHTDGRLMSSLVLLCLSLLGLSSLRGSIVGGRLVAAGERGGFGLLLRGVVGASGAGRIVDGWCDGWEWESRWRSSRGWCDDECLSRRSSSLLRSRWRLSRS